MALFLYRLFAQTLEPQGLTFEEYCADVGTLIANVHMRRVVAAAESRRN